MPQESVTEVVCLHHDDTPDETALAHIERLLATVERLRNERDGLRRHVDFLETEAKFSPSPLGQFVGITNSIDNARDTTQENAVLDFTGPTSAATGRAGGISENSEIMQRQLKDRNAKLAELEVKVEDMVQCLADATARCDTLQSQISLLEARDEERLNELEKVNNIHKETQGLLECTESSLAEITSSLEQAQSERDSLALQLTNLQSDLCNAQEDLAAAERRYSTLQFHQLSSMSSNEVVQSLREQIEELENRVLRRTEQIGIHQHDIKRLETNMRLQEERIAEMTAELETLSSQKDAMVEDCADAREARDEAVQRVEGLEMELEELEGRIQHFEGNRENELSSLVGIVMQAINQSRVAKQETRVAKDAVEMMRQAGSTQEETSMDTIRHFVVALAISQRELRKTQRTLRNTKELKSSLQNQLTTSQTQRDDHDHIATQQKERIAELESRLQDLGGTVTEMEKCHKATVQDLLDSKKQLQIRLSDAERIGDEAQTAEELAMIKAQLASTADDLERAKRQHSETEALYQEALVESSRLKQEIEIDHTQVRKELEKELSNLRADHGEEIVRLQQQLEASIEDARLSQKSLDTLRGDYQQNLDKLAETEKEYESRLSIAAERSQADKRQLETELTRSASQLAILQTRFDSCCETVTELERQLQEESNNRNAEREEHEGELAALSECSAQAESVTAQLHEEVEALRVELDKSRHAMESIQEEKEALQLDMTNLEAEIQRSISLGRYLESQVKDNEHTIASLKEALERTRADLSNSEKSGKAAEITLALHDAQHERAISTLQRELAALRSKPNLEEIVATLEERNQEMEESLRSKCAEIEQNDDRMIEMLKEKKKLITKVDNLTRKIQSLQNKLVANAVPTVPEPCIPETKSIQAILTKSPVNAKIPAPTAVPPLPRHPEPASSTPTARGYSVRVVSGPSVLPKSPDKKFLTPEVSNARIMNKPITKRISDPQPLSVSAGKKRKVPDEYDEGVPHAQGFSIDCLPVNDVVTMTPQRRLPHSGSGFTPVRNRPAVPSPKRPVNARLPLSISNITNSPRPEPPTHDPLAKPAKRTWLGKIKGVKTQAAAGTTVLERARSHVS